MNIKINPRILALLLAGLLSLAACTANKNQNNETEDSGVNTTVSEDDSTKSEESSDITDDTTDKKGESDTDDTEETTSGGESDNDEIIIASKEELTFKASVKAEVAQGSASVVTDEGLKYTATGFNSFSDGMFGIKDSLSIEFSDDLFADEFNRFVLCYVSDSPLKCNVTYTEDGKTKEDNFFLEAGTQSFSCLINDYLDGKKAVKLKSFNIADTYGKDAKFVLCNLAISSYTVYNSDTYYIENDRFKLGIRLSWGGGISYIQDKKSTIRGLTNLINQADTGRLVQQSYYGTGANGEYNPGEFNGSKWSYNPVQGGDQYQNHSRIIDIVVNKNSVYVKSQPQDWSLDNQITPSYMENSYTLYGDNIRVDNRFVDFSGWQHGYSSQEVPAFYTVSYLDRFTWYDGSKSWTDDKLSHRLDLNFWGDSKYAKDCTFYVRNANTETWCAWTNTKENYGIGLYVPNVDSFFAGRHAYNGTKNPNDGACNYVAPVNIKQLVSFEPIEYSYLIATGSVEEIRAIFKENKSFAENKSLHENYHSRRVPDEGEDMSKLDFTKEASVSFINASNNTRIDYDENEKAIKIQVTNQNDVQTSINYSAAGSMNASDYKKIKIEYMIPTTNAADSYTTELFLCAGEITGPTSGKSVRGKYIVDGQYHTMEIDLSDVSFWNGTINMIRYDYFDGCTTGDVIYVKSIELC